MILIDSTLIGMGIMTPIFIETVSMSRPHGKIIIANKANENSMFPVYGMIDLLGCTEGRREMV